MAQAKPDINDVFASEGDILPITSQEIKDGWVQEKPDSRVENFLQNRQGEMLKHINEQGVAMWDAITAYEVGAIVKGSNAELYTAITNNTGEDPVSTSGFWRLTLADIPFNVSVGTEGTVAGLEIGGEDSTVAYADFHSYGDAPENDYDARIEVSGGVNSQNAQASMDLKAKGLTHNGDSLLGLVASGLIATDEIKMESISTGALGDIVGELFHVVNFTTAFTEIIAIMVSPKTYGSLNADFGVVEDIDLRSVNGTTIRFNEWASVVQNAGAELLVIGKV